MENPHMTQKTLQIQVATAGEALIDMIVKATKTKSWAESLEKNGWTSALQTGKEFEDFVDREFASLRATMVKAGMV